MIYDTFSFYNELDVLEIRLNVLDEYVDHFVLTESPTTFIGKPKPLYFEENKERFERFLPKITHIVGDIVEDVPILDHTANIWQREHIYKNYVMRGLTSASDDSVVMFSDVDEIPDPRIIGRFAEKDFAGKTPKYCTCNMKMYYWYLNGFWDNKWPGTIITRRDWLRDLYGDDLYVIRDKKRRNGKKIGGGWHFTLIGTTKQRADIVKANCDKDRLLNGEEPKFDLEMWIDAQIKRGMGFGMAQNERYNHRRVQYVEIDETFPRYLYENQDKYRSFIR